MTLISNDEVVNLISFSNTHHFHDSVPNDYYVFLGGSDGYWQFSHEYIERTMRKSTPLYLPKAAVGFAVIGEHKDYRIPYQVYTFGDLKTIDLKIAVIRVAREIYGFDIDLDNAHREIAIGNEMEIRTKKGILKVSMAKLKDFLKIEEVK